MKFCQLYLFGLWLGWVQGHDSSITRPTSRYPCSTDSVSSSSSSQSPTPSTVREDPMTVTETVFTYRTTSTRVTRTIELTVTLTDHSTNLVTTVLTTTALSITQATVTTRQRAFVTLSTTLTRIVFTQSTYFEERTRTTTVETDTSITTVAVVSLLRTTSTTFFESSYAVTYTFTTQVLVTNQNTLIIFEPSVSYRTEPFDTLTIYTETILFVVNSLTTVYKTTITQFRTLTISSFLGTVTQNTIFLPQATTIRETSFDVSSLGFYFTQQTVTVPVRHSIEYSIITTLIR
jgi:hypothetical protein